MNSGHPSILVTGAAGIVGTAIRPLLREKFPRLLLSDIDGIDALSENEEFERGDLADFEFVRKLAGRADAIIHLGGLVGAHYTFEEVLGPNIVGTHHVLEAARQAGCRRVVFASSHHVVGFTPRGCPIDERTQPRPNGEYAVSKAFGEAAASYYVDNFALEILTIRIGYVGNEVSSERRLQTWISARDLVQLIEIGLTHPELRHEIVYGVSGGANAFFDNANAFRLGYEPQDRAADVVTDPAILTSEPDGDSIEEGVVGGGFASAGFQGEPARVFSRR